MQLFFNQISFQLLFSLLVFLAFLILVLWLFFNHGIDKLKHPEEWQDAGTAGERILYTALVKQFKIPENQIFRNVYIPREGGKTAELDLVVLSRKGIFIFECKNYAGNIYGDGKRSQWVQYVGNKKSYFYNPLLQNKNHVKYLKNFLAKSVIEVPIIPILSTIARGNWKIKNLGNDDYVLGINYHFKDIYESLPDSETTLKKLSRNFHQINPPFPPRQNNKIRAYRTNKILIPTTQPPCKKIAITAIFCMKITIGEPGGT